MTLPQEQLLYGLAGLVVLQVLLSLALWRLRGRDADGEARVEGDAVACPACEARNERGYRFCRSCVTELPEADGRASPSGGSPTSGVF